MCGHTLNTVIHLSVLRRVNLVEVLVEHDGAARAEDPVREPVARGLLLGAWLPYSGSLVKIQCVSPLLEVCSLAPGAAFRWFAHVWAGYHIRVAAILGCAAHERVLSGVVP